MGLKNLWVLALALGLCSQMSVAENRFSKLSESQLGADVTQLPSGTVISFTIEDQMINPLQHAISTNENSINNCYLSIPPDHAKARQFVGSHFELTTTTAPQVVSDLSASIPVPDRGLADDIYNHQVYRFTGILKRNGETLNRKLGWIFQCEIVETLWTIGQFQNAIKANPAGSLIVPVTDSM